METRSLPASLTVRSLNRAFMWTDVHVGLMLVTMDVHEDGFLMSVLAHTIAMLLIHSIPDKIGNILNLQTSQYLQDYSERVV